MIIVTCCFEKFELRARLQIGSITETVRAKNQALEMTFSLSASSHRNTHMRVPLRKNADSSSLFGLGCLIKNTDDRKGEAVGLMFCFNTLKTWTGVSPTLDWFGKNRPLTCV